MASANTLLSDACQSKVACLGHKDLLVVIAEALAISAGMTAQELLDAACDDGISCLDDKNLLIVIAEGINQGGGSGPGGAVQVYTGAAPPAAPDDPTKAAVFYPTGGGSLLQWDIGGAAWV